MVRLRWVAWCFSSFADIRSKRTGRDFLDLGDEMSLSPSLGTGGGLYRMWLPQRWNLSVNILRAEKHCEKLCGDPLTVHQRKCMLGKMETTSILPVGKVVQPLQSINYHDNCAHDHERHTPFTWLVVFGWVGPTSLESSRSGSWYAAGAKSMYMVWLQVGCLWALVSFDYRCDSCELEALDYLG
jgi:hypothetical protein